MIREHSYLKFHVNRIADDSDHSEKWGQVCRAGGVSCILIARESGDWTTLHLYLGTREGGEETLCVSTSSGETDDAGLVVSSPSFAGDL